MRTKEEVLKLFEDNRGLVKFIYNKNFKTNDMEDGSDLIQEGMIALYSACKGFDETKDIKFSTYACKAIFYRMLQYKERYLCKHNDICSLNGIYGHDENLELIELIEDYSVDFTQVEVVEIINKINRIANEKEKLVLRMRLEGKYQREIANTLKVSQGEVSRVCKRLGCLIAKIQYGEPIKPKEKGRPRLSQIRANEIRKKVRKLKNKGATYDEISLELKIPKGSISHYLRVS